MDPIVTVLIFVAIGVANWLFQKANEAKEKRKEERHEQLDGELETWREVRGDKPAAPSTEAPDDSMRRLMEALGLPVEAEPPPLPPRRAAPPEQSAPPVQPVPVQPVPVQPPPLPKTVVSQAPAPRVTGKPAFSPAKLSGTTSKPRPAVSVPEKAPAHAVRALLTSPDSLKKAVILTEILGAPKALRP